MVEVKFVCANCGVIGSANSFGTGKITLECDVCGCTKELEVKRE